MTGDTGDTEDSGETRGTGETGLTELTKLTRLTGLNTGLTGRVAKCHGYDGYIRVNKLARSGKIFGRTKNKQKQATLGRNKKPLQVCFVGFKR